jgi:hypothetical protein
MKLAPSRVEMQFELPAKMAVKLPKSPRLRKFSPRLGTHAREKWLAIVLPGDRKRCLVLCHAVQGLGKRLFFTVTKRCVTVKGG